MRGTTSATRCAASPSIAWATRGWLKNPHATCPTRNSTSTSASSYGIFSGEPKGWATILFSAKAARWVADEQWHSKQQGRHLPDGRYELKIPYSVSRELLMDILHYGADAEIVEPAVLREQAKALLELALSNYEKK